MSAEYAHTPDGNKVDRPYAYSSICAELEDSSCSYLVSGDSYYGPVVHMSLYLVNEHNMVVRRRGEDALRMRSYVGEFLDIFKQWATDERDLAND